MKKFKILKIAIIVVAILILATVVYAGYRMIDTNNQGDKTASVASEEIVKKSEEIRFEEKSYTEISKIGVQQVETFLMQEAERIAEEEKKKQEEEEKNKKDQKEKESDESFKKVTGSSTYYIRVNYQANTVTVYTKDSEGNYTVPCKAMVCSCGTWTPKSGTYSTTDKYKWRALVGGVSGKYATRITGQILFHSVPYINQSSDSLEYWEFDKLGTTASLGCVRLQVKDAKWIYDNCGWGTLVEFYGSSNPGPLGKPGAQKISSNEECRDWDPTDPEKGNPWHTYEEEQEEEEEKVKEDKKETNSNKDKNNNTSNNINNNTNNENKNNNATNNKTDKENTSENDKQEENKENETEKEGNKTEETNPEDGKEESGTEQVPEETEKNENPEGNGQEDNKEEVPDENGQGEDGEENNDPETTPTTDTEQAA